eukprot:2711322-Lingulodinium_polyedra.AAC.1
MPGGPLPGSEWGPRAGRRNHALGWARQSGGRWHRGARAPAARPDVGRLARGARDGLHAPADQG